MNRWFKFFLVIILGIILGLIYGWVMSPLQYRDTTPITLRYDYKTDFVLMVAEDFSTSQNADKAGRQLALLGSDPPADIVTQSLAHAAQMGYSSADMLLIQNMALVLQTWRPSAGGSIP